jgi:mannose-6-phosphate isomerase-like protein (cupin superfamily)
MSDRTDASESDVIDLLERARSADRRLAWSGGSEDLNLNLLVLTTGETVEEHVNAEVDVLLVGVAGSGTVAIDGDEHRLTAGQALVVPKGARRSIASTGERFAYLTCHRRRAGLWPSRAERG